MLLTALGCSDHQSTSGEAIVAEQIAAAKAGRSDAIQVREQAVSDSDLQLMADLPLRRLRLGRAAITDEGFALLTQFPQLTYLELVGPRIDNTRARQIAELKTLEFLNLPETSITGEGLAALATLPKLRMLRLGSPELRDEGVRHLKDFPKLRFLHLIDVPLSDRGLETIAALEGLQSFYLDGADVTDAGLSRLVELRPNLHIHIDQQHPSGDPHADHTHPPSAP